MLQLSKCSKEQDVCSHRQASRQVRRQSSRQAAYFCEGRYKVQKTSVIHPRHRLFGVIFISSISTVQIMLGHTSLFNLFKSATGSRTIIHLTTKIVWCVSRRTGVKMFPVNTGGRQGRRESAWSKWTCQLPACTCNSLLSTGIWKVQVCEHRHQVVQWYSSRVCELVAALRWKSSWK